MKRLVTTLLLLATLLTAGAAPARADGSAILIDGQTVRADVTPTVVGGVLMLPARGTVEALGGKVTWEADTRTVLLQTSAHQVALTPGQTTAAIDGHPLALGAPTVLQNGRLLVPASLLLTLYGDRLQIHHPGLIDPAAVSLLKQVHMPTHFDFQGKIWSEAQITGLDKLDTSHGEGMASRLAPPNFTLSMDGFIRGQNALVGMSMVGPDPIGSSSVRFVNRDGHAYMKEGGPWHELPSSEAELPPWDALIQFGPLVDWAREAHLGPARVVDGRTLQDVVLSMDPAAPALGLDGLLSAPQGMPGFEHPYLSLSATVTVDAQTHELRGFALEMQVMASTRIGEQQVGMHMVMHLAATLAPDTAPIVWPRDLR